MDERVSSPTVKRNGPLVGALLDDDELHELLQKLTVLARHAVRRSKSASITLVDEGRFRTSNSTGPTALAIDEAQYSQGDGPCLQALRSGEQLEVAVGTNNGHWQEFDSQASEEGIGRVLSTPLLQSPGVAVGALNIYAIPEGPFEDHDRQTASLIGEQAAILVNRALALLDSTRLTEQLREAVATREIIGEAKGILMESQSCTRDQAFDILRRASQRENRKLRELAEELVLKVEARATAKSSGRP